MHAFLNCYLLFLDGRVTLLAGLTLLCTSRVNSGQGEKIRACESRVRVGKRANQLFSLNLPLTLRVTSIKLLLLISMLCKTGWSWELRTWSRRMNLLDILSTSPTYFCKKWIGVSNENSNFDLIGFKGLRAVGKMTLFSRANFGRISRFYDSFRIEQSAII